MHKPSPNTNEISLRVKAYIDAGERNSFLYASHVREINKLKKSDAQAAYNALGLLERFHGNITAAADALKIAVNLDTTSAITNFNYAKILLRLANDDQAIYYAKRALDNAAFESDIDSYLYLYMMSLMLRFRFKDVALCYQNKIYERTFEKIKNLSILNSAAIAIKQMKKHGVSESEALPLVEVFNQILIDSSLAFDGFIWIISELDSGVLIRIAIDQSTEKANTMNVAFLQSVNLQNISSRIKDFFKVEFLSVTKNVQYEELKCPISGMTAAESIEISRALAESIRTRDYSNFELIEA